MKIKRWNYPLLVIVQKEILKDFSSFFVSEHFWCFFFLSCLPFSDGEYFTLKESVLKRKLNISQSCYAWCQRRARWERLKLNYLLKGNFLLFFATPNIPRIPFRHSTRRLAKKLQHFYFLFCATKPFNTKKKFFLCLRLLLEL